MSFNYNHTTIVGRLTKDPEIKKVGNVTRSSMTLAVDRPYRKEDGSTDTDFINVVLFGKLADVSEKHLRKGNPALFEGRIQVRQYEKNNENRWITEVLAENFQVLEYKKTN